MKMTLGSVTKLRSEQTSRWLAHSPSLQAQIPKVAWPCGSQERSLCPSPSPAGTRSAGEPLGGLLLGNVLMGTYNYKNQHEK